MSRVFATDPAAHSYDFNPYYSPEACGLKLLGDIETGASYEFCTTIALQDVASGAVFLAQDAGCSCPTPFENVTETGELIPFENADQVRRLISEHHYDQPSPADVHDFITKIEEAA